MKNYYFSKIIWTLLLAIFLLNNIAYTQSNNTHKLPGKANVEKVLKNNTHIFTFDNVIGKNQDDFSKFETKVSQVNFPSLISFEINPNSNRVIATFRKDAKEEDLQIFFKAVGYNGYQFI